MFASKYTASELQEKLSYYENAPETDFPSSLKPGIIKVVKMALSFKVPSPYIILKDTQAEESRKYAKLPPNDEELSFIELYRKIKGTEHSVYVDYKEARFLDELGLSGHFHAGDNVITEEQAEFLIPLLRGKIPSLHRKADVKKMNNFIERFISSYGPDFRDKWINDTKTSLFCNNFV